MICWIKPIVGVIAKSFYLSYLNCFFFFFSFLFLFLFNNCMHSFFTLPKTMQSKFLDYFLYLFFYLIAIIRLLFLYSSFVVNDIEQSKEGEKMINWIYSNKIYYQEQNSLHAKTFALKIEKKKRKSWIKQVSFFFSVLPLVVLLCCYSHRCCFVHFGSVTS